MTVKTIFFTSRRVVVQNNGYFTVRLTDKVDPPPPHLRFSFS